MCGPFFFCNNPNVKRLTEPWERGGVGLRCDPETLCRCKKEWSEVIMGHLNFLTCHHIRDDPPKIVGNLLKSNCSLYTYKYIYIQIYVYICIHIYVYMHMYSPIMG